MSLVLNQSGNIGSETASRFAAEKFTPIPASVTACHFAAVLIEKRQFIRESLAPALRAASGCEIIALSSVDEWLNVCGEIAASVLMLCGEGIGDGAQIREDIRKLSEAKMRVTTIILSEAEAVPHVIDAAGGMKWYIPKNPSLNVLAEAIRLARAGGVFIPAGCSPAPHLRSIRPTANAALGTLFTVRQEAVIEALRKGKANKVIAYELRLQESTVKVHIRNIMKKLKAKNRTEVAYLVGQITNRQGSGWICSNPTKSSINSTPIGHPTRTPTNGTDF